MDVLLKRAWLKGYRGLTAEYRALLEERGRWAASATKCTTTWSDNPKTSGEDKIQRATDKLADIDAQIFEKLDKIERLRGQIESAIDELEDSRQRAVLRLRYINGLSYEEISRKLHYDIRWLHRLEHAALEKLELP